MIDVTILLGILLGWIFQNPWENVPIIIPKPNGYTQIVVPRWQIWYSDYILAETQTEFEERIRKISKG